MTYDEENGIAHCPCGWSGVPTLLGKRGKLKGVNDHGFEVWSVKNSKVASECPACHDRRRR